MVKDEMMPFTELSLKDASLERLTKEGRLAREQLSLLAVSGQEEHPSQLDMGSVKHLLSDLRYKFSGRQQDMEDYIESEVKARTEELYRKAHYDALTHLPNRAYFHELMEQMVQRATETETKFTLLFLDLDGFKKVNDTLGHHIGDELLRHAAARLVSSLRENDIVARLGGDEFVALLTDSDDNRDIIESVCKRIISEISRLYYFEGNEVNISTSIGISRFPQDGKIASELSENADKALYVAKHHGKKQFRFYRDVVASSGAQFNDVELSLSKAISRNELVTCVQPQVDLKENRIVGGCLSVEWKNPLSRELTPAQWVQKLQAASWAESAANWLLDSGCHYLKEWQQLDSEFVVTIPVLEPLWNDILLTKLSDCLTRYGVSKNQIQLSFSMNPAQEKGAELYALLQSLSEQGYQVTLTDLGAQPLDLNFLAGLQIQEFKFDPIWLNTQMQTEKGQQWVKAMIQMVKCLDACMIATGIQTEEHYHLLAKWGCAYGQGSYWSDSIDSDAFKGLIG